MRHDDTSPSTAATKKISESTPIKAFWTLGDSSEQADRGIAEGFGKHPFGDDHGINVCAFLAPQLRQIGPDFEGDFECESLAFPHDVPADEPDGVILHGQSVFERKLLTPANMGDNHAPLEMQQDPSIWKGAPPSSGAREVGSTTFFGSSEVQELKPPDDPLPDFLDIGKAVEVMWDGDWWEAVIKYHGLGTVCVSYKGGNEEEDEWVWVKVDNARIRPPSTPAHELDEETDKNGHQKSRAEAWAPWRRLPHSPKRAGHGGRLPSPKQLDFSSSSTSKQVHKVEVSSKGLKNFRGISLLEPQETRVLKRPKTQEPSGGLMMLAQAAHDLVLAGDEISPAATLAKKVAAGDNALDDQDMVEKVKQRKRQAPMWYDDATLTAKQKARSRPQQKKEVRAKPQESRTKAKPRLIAMTKGKEDRNDRLRRFECVIKDLEHDGAVKVKRVNPGVLEDRKMALPIERLTFVDRQDCYESLNLNFRETQDMCRSHNKLCPGARETMRYLALMPVDKSDGGKYHWDCCKFKFNEQVRTERLERAAQKSK